MSSLTQVALVPWDPAFAIDRLVQACQRHPKRDHIWFSTQPCSSKFSFAKGEQSTVKERLVIHLKNDHSQTGWVTTCVDIVDKGKVPILFSVEQNEESSY